MMIASAVLRALVALPRRAGAYAFGIVFGFPDERLYGNNPGYRDQAAGSGSTTDGLAGDAHLRAVGTAITMASAGS
ncbi:MAG: hypothetical protein PGN11_12160 [Quadrisphaera sp.]